MGERPRGALTPIAISVSEALGKGLLIYVCADRLFKVGIKPDWKHSSRDYPDRFFVGIDDVLFLVGVTTRSMQRSARVYSQT